MTHRVRKASPFRVARLPLRLEWLEDRSTPASLALFFDPTYVDTTDDTGEGDQLRDSLESLGHTVTTFTGITDADFTAAVAGKDALVFPETDNGPVLVNDLSAAAKAVIADFVGTGGGLVMAGDAVGTQDTALLNGIFGFATADGPAGASTLQAAAAAGTRFAGGPAALTDNSDTDGLTTASLPAGSKAIYTVGADTTVALIPFGQGEIAFLGWDWFNALPAPGTQDGGWIDVLNRSVLQLTETVDVFLDGGGNLVVRDFNDSNILLIQADTATSRYVIATATGALVTTIAGSTGSGTVAVTVPFAQVTGSQVTVNGLGGDDQLIVDVSLGDFPDDVFYVGGAGSDTLVGPDVATAFTVTGGADAGVFTQGLFSQVENLTGGSQADTFTLNDTLSGSINGGGGSDTLIGGNVANTWNINGPNTGTVTGLGGVFASIENLTGGTAADNFVFADAASVGGTIDGGDGIDVLNYFNYTSAVRVNLGLGAAGLAAELGPDQEVPPTTSPAAGTVTVSNYDPATRTFDIAVSVTDFDPATVIGFHLHRAPVGVNGPVIIDLQALGALTPDGTGFTFAATGVTLPAEHEAAFLGGVTYVNIHTAEFPGGAIRGQVFSTGNVNLAAGAATGTGGVANVENALGGTAGDSLVGNFGANFLSGGAGPDTIVGAPGNDNMTGGGDDDVLVWSNGDNNDLIDGDAGADTVQVNGAVGAGDEFTVAASGTRIDFDRANLVPFSLDIGTAETLTVNGVGGDDTFAVASLAGVADLAALNLNGFAGDDTFTFADGATLLGGTIAGGVGTDTADYSAYTTPVAVNLGANAPGLVATLGADQEVPPTGSAATGTATITYDSVAHTFDISVTVDGVPAADVTGFHIHRGAFGTNGPIIVDFGTAVTATATGFTFNATGLALDPLHEAALLGGVTYVNVHTAAFPAGVIRGQVVASGGFVAVAGTATGTGGIANVENATGGSGSFAVGKSEFGDGLVGSIGVNVLRGGAGNDVLVGSRGNDNVQGEDSDDIIIWSNGDGTDVMDGGAGSDRVQVNGSVTADDVFTVAPGAVGRLDFDRLSPGPFSLDIGTVEQFTVVGYGGNDTFTVAALTGVADLTAVNLAGLDGDDTFTLADGATLLGGTIAGGTGTDTVDYAAYTTPVAVNLGANSPTLVASLDASQEAPPTASTATGSATVTYDSATHTFDISVTVDGILAADVTGFHIHRGALGVNGPIIEDFGTAALVATATGFTFNATGVPFDALHEAALLGGVTYLNVHTAANPGGAIRGQIVASAPLVAAPGTATGTAGLAGVENVTGGSGSFTVGPATFGDGLVGTKLANVLTGGAGNDVIVGAQGDDTMQGGDGDDILIWSNGDNNDLIDGDAGADTVQVNGAVGAGDEFTVAANGARLDFDRGNLVPFSLDIGSTETLAVNGVGGDDTFTVGDLTGVADIGTLRLFGHQGNDTLDASAQASAAVAVTLSGGADNDSLLGSPQADVLLGGPGTDLAVGNKGADQFLGGAGDDTFVWNNGDGSDQIEGEAGADAVQVNGAPAGDAFVVAPNGDRVRFDRTNLIPFTLDIGTSETLTVNGGDGDDAFAVTPLAGTQVEVNGGPPTAAPGDTLQVNLGGADSVVLPLPGLSDGQFTFGNRAAVVFTGLESITPTLGVGQDAVSQFAVGAGAGGSSQVTVFNPDQSVALALDAFPGFTGGVRVAVADVNGDGTPDLIVGTGPGGPTQVRVIDGKTKAELFSIQPFEATFTGGVYVAAGDLTGDGKADIVITPDEGGGPRVRIFSGDGFGQLADFFGIEDPNFRGGARAATGDVNGDGIADLLVAAGFGGGPRIAVFDGTSLTGTPVKFFGDFFVFEPTLRNGVFIGSGDLNGDGFADVIAGGGPGGGPRIFALSGQGLLGGTQTQVANFFAGDTASRGGIRLTAKDLDGDARADLVVGAGTGAGSRVTGYLGSTIPADGTPPEQFAFDAFPGFAGGVYVG